MKVLGIYTFLKTRDVRVARGGRVKLDHASERPERDVADGGAADTADCETKAAGGQALEQHVAAAVLHAKRIV